MSASFLTDHPTTNLTIHVSYTPTNPPPPRCAKCGQTPRYTYAGFSTCCNAQVLYGWPIWPEDPAYTPTRGLRGS
jgi:hypothetical protein